MCALVSFFRQDTQVISSEDTKPVYIITHCYMTYLNINHLIPLWEEKPALNDPCGVGAPHKRGGWNHGYI